MSNSYTIKRAASTIALDMPWDSELWQSANELKVDYRFDRGGTYKPDVRIRMLYDDNRICGMFQVKDQYVVARARHNQEQVCRDSCVEFFVQPVNAERYFNFEMNCGGTILLYHIKDLFNKEYDLVPESDLCTIERFHTLPKFIDEEITEPVYDDAKLFYWHRESKNSNAEVDYVVQYRNRILPIEVKSGKSGSMASLRIMMESKNLTLGVRTSEENFGALENHIRIIPLYMIGEYDRILRAAGEGEDGI